MKKRLFYTQKPLFKLKILEKCPFPASHPGGQVEQGNLIRVGVQPVEIVTVP